MLYSGAKGKMTPNNRLQRTAMPRCRTGTLACSTPDAGVWRLWDPPNSGWWLLAFSAPFVFSTVVRPVGEFWCGRDPLPAFRDRPLPRDQSAD